MNRDLFAASGGGVVDATTDPYFNSTTLLLSGDGTNGAQNNTFVDSSANNATITRAGSPTQGSFSPFSQTGWSGYFNGTGNYLYAINSVFNPGSTGAWTLECFVYPLGNGTFYAVGNGAASGNNMMSTYYNGSFGFAQQNGSSYVVTIDSASSYTAIQWYHYAVSKDSSNVIRLFINGIQVGTQTYSSALSGGTTAVINGRYDNSGLGNSGTTVYLSQLRWMKGTALYTTTPFAPPTAPLTAITGTSLLTLQDNRFKDNSTNNFAITASGTPSVQAFSPFAPTAAYSLPAAAAGSAYFNGSSYISVPDSTAFTMGSGDFTLEAWVYLTTSGTSRMIIGTCDAGGSQGSMSYILGVNASNNAILAIGYAGTLYTSTNTVTVPTNQWVHIAGVRNGGGIYAYLNGVQSTSNTSMASLAITDSTQTVAIGRNGAYNGEYVTGYISNARIVKGLAVYTGAFTPSGTPLSKIQPAGTNIAALSGTETVLLTLQDSTFKDNSTNVVTITASATPPVIQSFTPFTQVWGGSFNGTSTYLTPSNIPIASTGAFTIEFWMYPTSSSLQCIYSQYLSAGVDPGRMNVMFNETAGKIVISTGTSVGTGSLTTTSSISLNIWTHFAIVRDSSNVAKMYINGVLDATNATFTSTIMQTPAYIGYTAASPGYGFNGYLSNFRITNTAVYTGAFTPPAKTLSATQAAGTNISAIYPRQTSLLTLQDPTFKDNAILPNTITAAGTPKTQLVSAPFTSAATVDPVNGAAYFNGSTDYLSVPDNAAFEFGAGDFTLEGWFNFSSLPSTNGYQATLFAKWATGQPSYEVYLYNSSGTYALYFTYSTNGSTAINIGPISFTPSLGVWYHIALCKNSTNLIFYVNGSQQGATQTLSAALFDSTAPMLVGSFSTTANCYFNGYASNARIVNGTAVYTAAFQPPTAPLTAITNTSLLTLQDTTFKDNSTNALAITASGTPSMRAFTPFASNWGGYFNGTTDYLSVPYNSAFALGTDNFTIEGWFFPTSVASSAPLISKSAVTNATSDWAIFISASNGYIHAESLSSSAYVGQCISTVSVIINAWNHFAWIRSGSNFVLYLNGVSVATATSSASAGNGTGQSVRLAGDNGYTGGYFPGYLSNFRIVKGTAVYTTNFTPPSAPLTAITNTSLLTLQNNTFIDNSTNALAITATGAPKTQLLQLPFASSITKVPAPWNISVTAPLATVGGSMYFDGSSYLSVPPTSNFAFGTGDFTVECYIYGNSTTFGSGGIFSPNVWNGGSLYWAILANGGNVTWQSSHGNTNLFSISAVAYYNTWLHITVVRSSGTTKMYFNGVQVASAADSNNYVLTTTYVIARNGDGPYNMGAGYISNFRVTKGTAVYTGNFTPPSAPPQPTQTPGLLGSNVNAIDGTNTSLLLLGSNAGIYDATAKNDIVTVGNAQVSSTQIKYGTGAMYFDGTGDYLTIPTSQFQNYNFKTEDFTIECWLYQTAFSGDTLIIGSFTTWASSVNFYFATRAGSPNILIFRGGDSVPISINGNTGITANVWTHLAVSRASGVTRMFVGGILQTATHTGSVNISNTTQVIGIGAANNGTEPITGYIDDLRITKGVARYTTTFTPPTKAMIGQ